MLISYFIRLRVLCQPHIIIVMINKKISLKIKIERIKKNLSQEQLSELANLNRNTIGKIERCEVSPTVTTLEKIANALEIKFIDLVNVEDL